MVLFLFFLMIFLNKDYLNLLIIGIHIKLHKPSNNKGGSISTITIIKAAIKQPLECFLAFGRGKERVLLVFLCDRLREGFLFVF